MLGPQGWSVEREDPTALEDPVDDGEREVLVVQDAAPGRDGLVCREDHRALLPMTIVDDVKEHVGGVRAVREIPHFVDDQHARMEVRRQGVGETSTAKRRGQIIDQFRGGDEARIEAILDRPIPDRHSEMRFSPARFPAQNQAAAVGHKLRGQRRAEQ